LLDTDYRPTDNRPVPYWCISTQNIGVLLLSSRNCYVFVLHIWTRL